MKALLAGLATALVMATPMVAQDKPDQKDGAMKHEMKSSGWKELDEFHKTMAVTFHAAKGKNDLKPTRALAGELASKAVAWAASTGPAKCATETVKHQLNELAKDTKALADLVAAQGADDKVNGGDRRRAR